ncbi:MAG: hypothetical protein LBI59_07250, partial [Candidatus Accumulibacter sp.]|nr:hypothetical protein [Accumulibacter sp.]
MNRIKRYKRLALLLGYSLAGVFASACPGDVAAQTLLPLKVDAVLLGSPPVAAVRPDAAEKRQDAVEPETPEARSLALPDPAKADIVDEMPERVALEKQQRDEADFVRQSASASEFERATPLASAPSFTSEMTTSTVEPSRSLPLDEKKKTAPTRTDEEARPPESTLNSRSTTMTKSLPADGSAPRPVFLSARRMAGEVDREFIAEGDVELRRDDSVVNSDMMTYWPLEDEVEAEGRVRLQQKNDVVTGPKMRLRLEDQVGYFEQPAYQLRHQSLLGEQRMSDREDSTREIESLVNTSRRNAGFAAPQIKKSTPEEARPGDVVTTTESRGEAERIDFEGENQYRLLNNTFTTCPVDNDAWYVRTSELRLDYDYEVADGRDATVYF